MCWGPRVRLRGRLDVCKRLMQPAQSTRAPGHAQPQRYLQPARGLLLGEEPFKLSIQETGLPCAVLTAVPAVSLCDVWATTKVFR